MAVLRRRCSPCRQQSIWTIGTGRGASWRGWCVTRCDWRSGNSNTNAWQTARWAVNGGGVVALVEGRLIETVDIAIVVGVAVAVPVPVADRRTVSGVEGCLVGGVHVTVAVQVTEGGVAPEDRSAVGRVVALLDNITGRVRQAHGVPVVVLIDEVRAVFTEDQHQLIDVLRSVDVLLDHILGAVAFLDDLRPVVGAAVPSYSADA